MYHFGRHVGVQQGGAQTRLGFAVRLHDALYLSQQLGVFVFRFWLNSGRNVIDTNDACLIFMDADFYGSPVPAKHILRNTLLAIEQRLRNVTHRTTPCWPRDQFNQSPN
jgi:hypothetical protein